MALHSGLPHRIQEQDSRRILFQHQFELMSAFSLNWGAQLQHEHDEILKKHPFDDFVNLRSSLRTKLRGDGYSEDIVVRMAEEQYPPPIEP
jgi:hypothetical protein